MKILRCDSCRKEVEAGCIVGNEFEQKDYITLSHSYRFQGQHGRVTDVCPDCYAIIQRAAKTAVVGAVHHASTRYDAALSANFGCVVTSKRTPWRKMLDYFLEP